MHRPPAAGTAEAAPPGRGETVDAICGGAVRIIQREQGYRFNLDPILLAHFAQEASRGLAGPAIDLGTGSGIIPILLARKFGKGELTAVELQPSLHALAERNVRLNGCGGRIHLVHGDLREVTATFQPSAYAHVLCNPPYGRLHGGRLNPTAERAIARHELCCTLEDVARAARHLLSDGGNLWLVYPAARLTDVVLTVTAQRLTPRRLRLVHPFSGERARLALVQAVKGGRSQLTVCPPLWLHERGHPGFTPEVARMLGGEEAPAGAGSH